MEFPSQYREKVDLINEDLDSFFQIYREFYDPTGSLSSEYVPRAWMSDTLTVAREFVCTGGKRLRPLLTLLVAKAYGATQPSLVRPALSVELVHNSTLVHDDFMDGDRWRRGNPTVHEKLKEEYTSFSKEHYPNFKDKMTACAISEATLVGNLLNAMGNRTLTEYDWKNGDHGVAAVQNLADAYTLVNLGQKLDLRGHQSMGFYNDLCFTKTAVMFIAAARIGANLTGNRNPNAKNLDRVMEDAGKAFQMQDDLQDLEPWRGEKRGSDIRNGRTTILTALLTTYGTNPQMHAFAKYLGKKDLDAQGLENAIDILDASKMIRRAQVWRDKQIREAKKGIRRLHFPRESEQDLLEFVQYLGEREH